MWMSLIQDDPKLFDENVDEKVKSFVSAATNQVNQSKKWDKLKDVLCALTNFMR